MIINVVYDEIVSSLPTGFVAAINQVVAYFDHHYTNNINVTIDVGYGTFDGGVTVDPLGVENSSLGNQTDDVMVSYTTLRNLLISHATSADDALACSNLPVNDPYFGGDNTSLLYRVQGAEARALGLLPANGNGSIDAWVGFMAQGTSGDFFTFDPNNRASPNANTYDFFGTAYHEISHALGRVSDVARPGLVLAPLDLFRFDGPGSFQAGDGAPAYFSIDGGVHNLDNYATSSDQADWASTALNDANLASSPPNAVNWFTSTDVRQLDILGYTRAPATASDLTGDGVSDVLLYNSNNSQVGEWLMQSGQLLQGQAFGTLGVGSGWSIVGSGDLNGDSTSDILLYNSNTSQVGEWLMQNGHLSQGQAFGSLGVGSGWSTAGTGDFNGDHTTDILLYNSNTSQVGEWLMQNGQLSQGKGFGTLGVGSGWTIAGTGDFNGDHTTDILLYNSNTSQVGEWLMQNGQLTAGPIIGSLGVSSGWSIAGTGDFNGDGTSDILLYNSTNTQVGEWLMQNGQLAQGQGFGTLGAGSGWQLKQV